MQQLGFRMPDRGELRAAIRNVVLSQAVGAILPQMLLEGGLLSLLILYFGGTDLEVGVASTVFNATMISGLFLMPVLEVRSRKQMLYRWISVSVISLFLLFLVQPVALAVGSTAVVWYVILVMFLYGLSLNLGSTAWLPYLADLVPSSIRGRFFGRMRTLWRLTAFVGTAIGGLILGKEPHLGNFYVALGFGSLFSGFYIWFLRKLPEIPPRRAGAPESLWQTLREPLSDASFRRFLFFASVLYFLYSAATPFAVPFIKRDLSFPSSLSVYASSCIGLGAVASLIGWGKLSDRWGNRIVFIASMTTLAVSYTLIGVIPPFGESGYFAFAVAVVAFLFLGVGMAGCGLAYTVRLMSEAKAAQRGAYMAIGRILLGTVMAVGPAVAGIILRHVPGAVESRRVFFLTVAVLMFMASFLVKLLRRIREKRARTIMYYMLSTSANRLASQLLLVARLVRRRSS